jgi:N-acetylglucosamine kinase-like BadF-type ATPase
LTERVADAGTVLAVDGGNSKTDLAIVGLDGSVSSLVRGPGASPHQIGLDGCLAVLTELSGRARADAGLAGGPSELPLVGVLMIAGADLPAEEAALAAAVAAAGFAASTTVRNDTYAILRTGTDRGWGVAVACGAGINCVGVAPDGREHRFGSLGPLSGDWGGGGDLGLGAVGAAVRAEDGRGPGTVLAESVPAYFGLASPAAVAEAFHLGAVKESRLVELAPLVLAASAAGDAEAGRLVDRLADEVVAFVRAAVSRLGLAGSGLDVVLGGGLLRAGHRPLDDRVRAGVLAMAPAARVVVAPHPPIVGAALLALDAVGAPPAAADRLRQAFSGDSPLAGPAVPTPI